jgi:GAF domain-containing protein
METPPFYTDLLTEAKTLLASEANTTANLANLSALLYQRLPDINWVGFYLLDESQTELILGPFQGKPAVTRIALGSGVCGQSAANQEPLLVDNVCAFGDHIVCDPDSKSECVIPFYDKGNKLLGVLDIDSPKLERFSEEDLRGLLPILALL